jgi:GNAT superfamily N-acetyltransferase
MSKMPTTIRTATAADVAEIMVFIRALAAYERAPEAVTATEADLLRDGFGPNPYYFCLIAEHDGRPAGFAFYFFDYSTWLGRPGIYLEDLFVHPEFRGLGIGKALLQRVAAVAIEKNCARLKWEVLDWNTPAIDFYGAMGAEFMDAWRNVRLEGEALLRLADGAAANAGSAADRTSVNQNAKGQNEAEENVADGNVAGAASIRRFSGERVGDHEPRRHVPDEAQS